MRRLSPALLVIVAMPLCAGDLVHLTAAQRQASGIEFSTVEVVDNASTIPYPAQVVVPNAKLQLVSAPQEGIIEAMLVAEGENVQAGQSIARLRSPQLLESQRALLEAVNRSKLASDRVLRDQSLVEEGIVSYRRLLESRAELQRWNAVVQQQREALRIAGMSAQQLEELESAGRLVSTLEITAPLQGIVLAQSATVGQHVVAADPLYRIGNLDQLWLEIHVPLSGVAGVTVGDPVQVVDPPLPGQVITIGRMVHAEDQGVMVRAEVNRDVQRLRPGQFVQVRLAIAGGGNALRVPAAAVVRENSDAFVFVEGTGGLEVIPVQILAEEAGSVVVAGSLTSESRVVSQGIASVKAAWKSQSQ